LTREEGKEREGKRAGKRGGAQHVAHRRREGKKKPSKKKARPLDLRAPIPGVKEKRKEKRIVKKGKGKGGPHPGMLRRVAWMGKKKRGKKEKKKDPHTVSGLPSLRQKKKGGKRVVQKILSDSNARKPWKARKKGLEGNKKTFLVLLGLKKKKRGVSPKSSAAEKGKKKKRKGRGKENWGKKKKKKKNCCSSFLSPASSKKKKEKERGKKETTIDPFPAASANKRKGLCGKKRGTTRNFGHFNCQVCGHRKREEKASLREKRGERQVFFASTSCRVRKKRKKEKKKKS